MPNTLVWKSSSNVYVPINRCKHWVLTCVIQKIIRRVILIVLIILLQ